MKDMQINEVITPVKSVLERLKAEGKIHLAILYGSFASGKQHSRSDIDLAVYLTPMPPDEETAIIDEILMSSDRQINILRLNDDEESPFVIQEALKGIHLVEPDRNVLYSVSSRALHETEEIRFRRIGYERAV